MSTRAQVRFATRETGQSFNEHPEKIHAQFYVHHDGYPEGLGMNIAESISMNNNPPLHWEIEHIQTKHGDLEYIYYIWSDYDKETWISIFEVGSFQDVCHECGSELGKYPKEDKCIFVGTAVKLIEKYQA
tara:strand:+ start:83 stop:472 length:390 start_codon:yes stop_codon:yes gene_type:complete